MYCINHVKVTYFYCYYVYSKLNKAVIFLFNEMFDMHFEVLLDLIVHISNYRYPKCPIYLLALCGSYYFNVCIFIIVKNNISDTLIKYMYVIVMYAQCDRCTINTYGSHRATLYVLI